MSPAGGGQVRRAPAGGLVDRSQPLRFTFDGRRYDGFAGDTLASALLANGVGLVGRSFKYHRPRGILSAGPEEPNALVELRTGARREPNARATTVELFDGLEAASQNRWPSLRHDVLALNGLAAPLLTAGFYYKTFMWPASFWERVYEPLIRRAAGLGRAADGPDPDTYERAHLHCDVLVVGSGPAGLLAALTAGRAGARVVLCEEDFRLGGRLLGERRVVAEEDGGAWVAAVEAELESLPEVRILRRTTVFGAYDGGTFGAIERVSDHLPEPAEHGPRQRAWRIVARRCVLAAGAIERPLVFGDNDRPGIMLAGGVRTYLNRYGVRPGAAAVVFANNEAGACATVRDLAEAGIAVAAVVEPRAEASEALAALARRAGARLVVGGAVTRALGGRALAGCELRSGSGERVRIACDLLAMSGGWSPTLHLASHHGARPRWDEGLAAFVADRAPAGMVLAGAASGAFGLSEALAGGARAGLEAALACGHRTGMPNLPETDPEPTSHEPLWRVRGVRGKAFVDFQNDVTVADVEIADREGFRSVELLKRYTTLGMATDGGKTSNVNGLALMAELTARTIGETGTTVFRPPYTPVAIAALAGHSRGRDFRPTRRTPAHRWAEERGAVFVESGPWLRAAYFPRPDEGDWLAAVNREVATTRGAAGFCDVSTLGKIDIQGRDAATFLDFVCCNTVSTLAVGRARYGLMLREDGFVLDDGTTARLGPTHFLTTTTTANAARVMQHLEFCHQVLRPGLDVRMTSVSEHWAQFSVAGPRSREVLLAVVDPGHDLSDAAFPFMAAGPVAVGGVPARLFRLSFSGELAFELAVPASCGDALARALDAATRAVGGAPYGTEALGVMRIEKGHVGGAELNGQTTARDLGLGRILSTRKDCIGRTMAGRPGLLDPDRPTLVGLRPLDPAARLRAGAHLVAAGRPALAEADEGHVTSAAFSPTLGQWIGLGLLARGPERHGERIRAVDPIRDGAVDVEVCHPVFVDPEGSRLRG